MGKQFGKDILAKVLERKAQGYTHQMIGEEFGYSRVQIKKLVERYNKKQRSPFKIPIKRGRQRKRPISTEEDYKQRIKQLEMENDLLRSFLQAAGRM